jgi:hypothetical protein
VRNYPAGQAWTQLYQARSFTVYEYRDSGWVRGYAWGHVDTDQSPYAPPYDDVRVETAGPGQAHRRRVQLLTEIFGLFILLVEIRPDCRY